MPDSESKRDERQRRTFIDFVLRDNVIPLVVTLISAVLVFGSLRGDVQKNTSDITDLKRWREEDHNTLKDVQGDVKAIRATIEKRR